MSVLLDALKKAAEQKLLKQNLQADELVETAVSPPVMPSTEKLSFSLVSDLNAEQPNSALEEPKAPLTETPSIELTLSEVPEKEVLGFNEEPISSTEDSNSVQFKLTPIDKSPEETDVSTEDPASLNPLTEPHDLIEFSQPLSVPQQLESNEIGSSSVEDGIAINLSPIETDAAEPEAIIAPKKQEQFDWSLSNIPAYQQAKSQEQQFSTNVLKGLGSKQEQQASRSAWWLLALLLVLFLAGLGLYLLDYYEKSQAIANKSLKRFELPAKEITVSMATSEQSSEGVMEPIVKDNILRDESADINQSYPLIEKQDIVLDTKVLKSELPLPSPSITPVAKLSQSIKEVESREGKSIVKQPAAKKLLITSDEVLSKEQQGYIAYQEEDYLKALELYQQAFSQNPKSLASLFGLAAIAIKTGETQKALSYYEMAERLEPSNPKVQSALISMRSASGSYESWAGTLKSQLADNPQDANLHFSLGNLYVKRGDWVNAQERFFKALELSPGQMQYALNLAISLDHLGQYALAEQYYQNALALSSASQPLKSETQIKERILAIQQFLKDAGRGN